MVKKQNAVKGELNQRFSFRKLSAGLAGVALSSFWLVSATGNRVHAAENNAGQKAQAAVVTNETNVAGAKENAPVANEASKAGEAALANKTETNTLETNTFNVETTTDKANVNTTNEVKADTALTSTSQITNKTKVSDALKAINGQVPAKVIATEPMKSVGNTQELDTTDFNLHKQLGKYTRTYAARGLRQSLVAGSTDAGSTHISQIPDISDPNPAKPGEVRNEYVIYGWGPKTNTEKQLTDQVLGLEKALSGHNYHIRYDDFNQQVSRAITIHYTNGEHGDATTTQTGNLHRILGFVTDEITQFNPDGTSTNETKPVEGYPRLTAGSWMLRTGGQRNAGTEDANSPTADGVSVDNGTLYFNGYNFTVPAGYIATITDSSGQVHSIAELNNRVAIDTDSNNAILFNPTSASGDEHELVPTINLRVDLTPTAQNRTVTFVDDDNGGASVPQGSNGNQLNSIVFNGVTDQTRNDLLGLVNAQLDGHKFTDPNDNSQRDTFVLSNPDYAPLKSFKYSTDANADNAKLVIHVKHNKVSAGGDNNHQRDQNNHNVYAMTHIDNHYKLQANVPDKYLSGKDKDLEVKFHRNYTYDPVTNTYTYDNTWVSNNGKTFSNGQIALDSVSQLFHNDPNISHKNINHYTPSGNNLAEDGVTFEWVSDNDTQGHYVIKTNDLINLNKAIIDSANTPAPQNFGSSITWNAQPVSAFVFHFKDTTNNPNARNKGTITVSVGGTVDHATDTTTIFDVNNVHSPLHGMVKEGNVPNSVSFINQKGSDGNWNIAPVTTDYNVHQNISSTPVGNPGDLGLTDHDVHRVFTRTINVTVNGNDKQTTVQKVEFRRDAYADPALDHDNVKGVIYSDWHIVDGSSGYTDTHKTATTNVPNSDGHSNSPIVTINGIPEAGKPGYKLDIGGGNQLPDGQGYTVPQSAEIYADTDPSVVKDVNLNYISQNQTVQIQYIDQNTNSVIPNSLTLSFNGNTDQTVSTVSDNGTTKSLKQYIKDNAPKNWDIISGDIDNYTFKANDRTVLQVVMNHHHDSIGDGGGTSGLNPKPKNPQDVSNDATEDVWYINQDNNEPKYHAINRSIHFHRGGDYDEVTRIITPKGNWIADTKDGESTHDPSLNDLLDDNAKFDDWVAAPIDGYDLIAKTSNQLGYIRL